MELYLEVEGQPGARVVHKWLNQGGLDLEGARDVARETEVAVTVEEEARA